jgi:predicted RNA binding protein YcfA (HicA-like mRNA interferase family)
MKVREAITLVEADGWYLARTRGSHRHFKHPSAASSPSQATRALTFRGAP